jgi:hypothetical protein
VDAETCRVTTFELEVHQLAVNAMLGEELFANVCPNQVRTYTEYNIRHMARQLAITLRIPGKKLPRVLVASYPATWWDHLKARFGWKHQVQQVYREDIAVYPDIAIPDRYAQNVRIYSAYSLPEFAAVN